MSALLIALLLSGSIELHGSKLPAPIEPHDARRGQTLPIILVADGSPGWQSQQTNKILGELSELLGSSRESLVARFDAEPTSQRSFAIRGANSDLVTVRPRTPMREAMETGFGLLMGSPPPHAMVVIAYEQFYPTSVPTSRLLELARRSATTVHTIHLASTQAQGPHGFGQHLRNGMAWTVERLMLHERGYSAGDTARFLKLMSDATGGTACVAEDASTGMACADTIAATMER